MKTLLLQIDRNHFSKYFPVHWITVCLGGFIVSTRSYDLFLTYELKDNKKTRTTLYSMMLSLSITMDINDDVTTQSGMLTDFIHCVAKPL